MTEARRTCDVERLWRPAGGNGDFNNSPDPGPDSDPDPEPDSDPDPEPDSGPDPEPHSGPDPDH